MRHWEVTMCDNPLAMEACRPDAPALSSHDVEHMLSHVDNWALADRGRLEKRLKFDNHYEVMAFVNAVAWISHREDHHPELLIDYDSCTVRYWTHAIDGLSRNDFLCAAKVDTLVS